MDVAWHNTSGGAFELDQNFTPLPWAKIYDWPLRRQREAQVNIRQHETPQAMSFLRELHFTELYLQPPTTECTDMQYS